MKYELKAGRTELGEKRGAPEQPNGMIRMVGTYADVAARAYFINEGQDKRKGRYFTFFPSPLESESD